MPENRDNLLAGRTSSNAAATGTKSGSGAQRARKKISAKIVGLKDRRPAAAQPAN